MLRISFPGRVPYGGTYKLNYPEVGIVGQGNSLEALMASVKKWRLANGLPNGLSLQSEVEKLACQDYPSECDDVDPTVPVKRKLNFRDVTHGTQMMVLHKIAGSPLVSPEVATARAGECLRCPYISHFSYGCGGLCGALRQIVETVIGSKTTPLDEQLENKTCSICGCFTKVSIWVPTDLQRKVLDDGQKVQFDKVGCWKSGK